MAWIHQSRQKGQNRRVELQKKRISDGMEPSKPSKRSKWTPGAPEEADIRWHGALKAVKKVKMDAWSSRTLGSQMAWIPQSRQKGQNRRLELQDPRISDGMDPSKPSKRSKSTPGAPGPSDLRWHGSIKAVNKVKIDAWSSSTLGSQIAWIHLKRQQQQIRRLDIQDPRISE